MGVWKQIAPLPNPRWDAPACVHDGKVYLLGGQQYWSGSSSSYTSTLYIYDPATNTWSTGAALPAIGMAYAFSTASDGIHLVYPGTGAHYAYDPGANTWAARATTPVVARRDAHHFVDTSGRFYLAGGRLSGGGTVVAVHRYDPVTGVWSARGDMPTVLADRQPTVEPGALGDDSKIYLGYSGFPKNLTVYDPTADTWSTSATWPGSLKSATDLNVARLSSGIIVALPHIDFSGPSSSTQLLRRVDGYDPVTGTWSLGVVPDFPGSNHDPGVASEPGGGVFLLGGLVQDVNGFDTVTAASWSYNQNEAPTAATLLTLTGGVLVSTAVKNRARHQFNDPNVGDSQSKFDWRHRIVDTTTWTTGTVESPNPWYDIDAGDLDAGDYERQVLPYDAAGVSAPGWTPSGFFTAADPPAGPTITYPINGQTLEQVEHVDWSVAAQDSYQVRRVADDAGAPDPSVIYFDTGEIVDTLARTLPLEFETNNRDEHVQVRVKFGGLWSDYDDVGGEVTYTPPPAPSVTVYPDISTGSLLLMITNPDPTEDEPAAAYNDVYVDDGAGAERKATELATNVGWRYWTPISGRDYASSIRVVAVAANGTTASSGG